MSGPMRDDPKMTGPVATPRRAEKTTRTERVIP